MIARLLTVLTLSFLLFSTRVEAMSLNVHEGDLHSTLMLIADMGELNVVIDDSVRGTVTISLNEVEPLEALKIVARTKNLMMTVEGSTFILTADRNNNSLRNSYVLKIKYGDAETLREAVALALDLEEENADRERHHLSGVRDWDDRERTTREYSSYYYDKDETNDQEKKLQRLMINRDANALILYGTQLEYERALKILAELDVPLKQISLEARIVAINKSATKDLGVEWFWSSAPQYPDYDPPSMTSSNSITQYNSGDYTRRQSEATGFGILQFGRGPEGLPYEWYYGARINALITNGKARMLSKPNITTVQGREAIINVGDKVPIPRVDMSDSITTTSFEYQDASIKLICTPRVNDDGSITATIHTEVSTPHYVADLKTYRFNTRSADTTVTMQDSQPIVIGGLIGKDEEKSIRKIPFLGDLPILGALFKNVRRNKSDSELVIFLTAHVLEN